MAPSSMTLEDVLRSNQEKKCPPIVKNYLHLNMFVAAAVNNSIPYISSAMKNTILAMVEVCALWI